MNRRICRQVLDGVFGVTALAVAALRIANAPPTQLPRPKAATSKAPSPHSKTLTRWRELLSGSWPTTLEASPQLGVGTCRGWSRTTQPSCALLVEKMPKIFEKYVQLSSGRPRTLSHITKW